MTNIPNPYRYRNTLTDSYIRITHSPYKTNGLDDLFELYIIYSESFFLRLYYKTKFTGESYINNS
jgi:hypothetical protein